MGGVLTPKTSPGNANQRQTPAAEVADFQKKVYLEARACLLSRAFNTLYITLNYYVHEIYYRFDTPRRLLSGANDRQPKPTMTNPPAIDLQRFTCAGLQ